MCWQQTQIVTKPDWKAVKDGLLPSQTHLLTPAVVYLTHVNLYFYQSFCPLLFLESYKLHVAHYYTHMQQLTSIDILSLLINWSHLKRFLPVLRTTQKRVSIYIQFTFGYFLRHKLHMEQFLWVVTFNLGHLFIKVRCHQCTIYWSKKSCR